MQQEAGEECQQTMLSLGISMFLSKRLPLTVGLCSGFFLSMVLIKRFLHMATLINKYTAKSRDFSHPKS